MANIVVAYILWLFGGIWGAHHWYLGRDNQAFLWATSLGGFTLGWLRDFFKIPSYLAEEQLDSTTRKIQDTIIKCKPTPPLKWIRTLGQYLFGNYFGYITSGALASCYYVSKVATEELPPLALHWMIAKTLLYCLGCSAAVSLTGDVGTFEKGSFWKTLKGGLFASAVCVALPDMRGTYWPIVITCIVCWNRSREWDKRYQSESFRVANIHRGCCRSGFKLFAKATIFGLLFTNWALFSVSVDGQDGETIVLIDSLKNMLKSPAFKDFFASCKQVYDHIQSNGWENFFKEIMKHLDADGVGNSFSVLGLDSAKENEYNINDIKKVHRKLALKYHPDKQKGKTVKEMQAAEEKFREIQEAYEKLSKMYKRKPGKDEL